MTAWRAGLAELAGQYRTTRELRIVLVGATGSGKSTLINAILQRPVLPVSTSRVCTAVPIIVRDEESLHGRASLRAEVHFRTRASWDAELQRLCQELQPTHTGARTAGTDAESDEAEPEAAELRRRAEDVLCSVYGTDVVSPGGSAGSAPTVEGLRKRRLSPEVEAGLDRGQPLTVFADDPRELQRRLLSYWSAANVARSSNASGSAVQRYWPLVTEVRLWGDFPALRHRLVLTDLPGLADPNLSRSEAVRRFVHGADSVWVAFGTKRSDAAFSRELHDVLTEDGLLGKLLLAGRVDGLVLIATHADEFMIESAAEEAGLPPDAPFAEILAARNREVSQTAKSGLLRMLRQLTGAMNVDPQSTAGLRASLAATPVLPVSAPAYLKLCGQPLRNHFHIDSCEQTGFPDLLNWLRRLSLVNDPRQRAEDFRRRVAPLLSEVRTSLEKALSDSQQGPGEIETTLRRWLAQREQPWLDKLNKIRQESAQQFDAVSADLLTKLFESPGRWAELMSQKVQHRENLNASTMKALIAHKGKYTDSKKEKYNLNEEMLQPFRQQIGLLFEQGKTHWKTTVDEFLRQFARLAHDFVTFLREAPNKLRQQYPNATGLVDFLAKQADICQEHLSKGQDTFRTRVIEAYAVTQKDVVFGLPSVFDGLMEDFYKQASGVKPPRISEKTIALLHQYLEKLALTDLRPAITSLCEESLAKQTAELDSAYGSLQKCLLAQLQLVLNNLSANSAATTPGTVTSPQRSAQLTQLLQQLQTWSERLANTAN